MTSRVFAPDELYDAEFLASLRTLRIVARRVTGGGRFADQRSKDLGSGIEFRDFRPYAPGDELKSVDWNIYRRLGRVVLRLFEEWEDLPLYLLPDVSESTVLEDPPRLIAGLRTALALASISLGQHDPVGIYPFADGLVSKQRPKAGKRRLLRFAAELAAIPNGGATNTPKALRAFHALKLRPGLAVVISDFYDPAGLEPVLAELRKLRHRLLLVQLVRKSDREPDLQGDVRLLDCETGEHADVSISGEVLAKYREAHDKFERDLTKFAAGRGVGLLRLDVEEPVVPQLASIFEGRHLPV